MNPTTGFAKGKQVLRLQANEIRLLKEGEEEGKKKKILLRDGTCIRGDVITEITFIDTNNKKLLKAWFQVVWQLIPSQILVWMCILLLGKSKKSMQV
jgi:hypothetical protein